MAAVGDGSPRRRVGHDSLRGLARRSSGPRGPPRWGIPLRRRLLRGPAVPPPPDARLRCSPPHRHIPDGINRAWETHPRRREPWHPTPMPPRKIPDPDRMHGVRTLRGGPNSSPFLAFGRRRGHHRRATGSPATGRSRGGRGGRERRRTSRPGLLGLSGGREGGVDRCFSMTPSPGGGVPPDPSRGVKRSPIPSIRPLKPRGREECPRRSLARCVGPPWGALCLPPPSTPSAPPIVCVPPPPHSSPSLPSAPYLLRVHSIPCTPACRPSSPRKGGGRSEISRLPLAEPHGTRKKHDHLFCIFFFFFSHDLSARSHKPQGVNTTEAHAGEA